MIDILSESAWQVGRGLCGPDMRITLSPVLQPEKGGDPSVVRDSQKKRGAPEEIVEEVLRMYKEWTQLDFTLNGLQKETNAVQKEITTRKKAKENADDLMATKATCDKKIAELKPQVAEAEAKMRTKTGEIGNIVGDKVPISQTEVSGAQARAQQRVADA